MTKKTKGRVGAPPSGLKLTATNLSIEEWQRRILDNESAATGEHRSAVARRALDFAMEPENLKKWSSQI